LVVGIYRSNVVDETHIFNRTLQDLKEKSREEYFEMFHLEIGNLSLESVHSIIQDLLGMDSSSSNDSSALSSRTLRLAEVCFRKTHGNVFFLLQFVSMLKERHMLRFNFGLVSWTWNEKEVEASTNASDNVVDLLMAKMAELSEDLVHLLKLASCLGSTFDLRTLSIVWDWSNTGRTVDDHPGTLIARVATLVVKGYMVKNESKSTQHHQRYTWIHDKIQEAALALVPAAEQGVFAAKVGQILLSHLEEKELDSAIFVVVNLLNGKVDGPMEGDQTSRHELARLNWRASQKAILCSAFDNAAGYAAKGIQWLPENAWVCDYELCLNLYTVGAKAESVLGNTETMERYCQQVIMHADFEDKLGVYNVWLDSVVNRVLIDEARDLSLAVLEKYNCRFPKSPVLVGLAVVKNVLRVKRTMKSIDASTLPFLRDSTRLELLKILDRLGTIFYITKDNRLPLAIFKGLNWTMKYGYCDCSPVAFASIGLILTGALNDLQGGSKYAEQALILQEQTKSQMTVARTMFLVNGFTFPWTKPLRSLLTSALRGYDVGLQTG
jgi:predicted ATPase